MRIAIVTTSYPASEDDAAGHFVRSSARELERQGHEVEVVSPPPGGAFGWPGAAARLRERPLRLVEAAWWLATARARIAAARADRVIAHWALPSAWPIGVAARGRLEVVSHGGDVRLVLGLPALLRRVIVRAIAARASAWTFVSARLRDDLLHALDGETRDRVDRIARVAAPVLDMPDVREAVARRRLDLAGTRAAVSVGRLVPSKRVDRAIEHVACARDLDALVVVGDGPERARLEDLARDRRVDVRFVGAVGRREALAWIGAADVLLHGSVAEGLSTVIREAESLGTRVVRL
ncbi:MAG TPA: glycosyltransferase family 4 protein [Acidimicrobiia bacterium]